MLESSLAVGQQRLGSLGWIVVKRELRDQAALMLNPHRRMGQLKLGQGETAI